MTAPDKPDHKPSRVLTASMEEAFAEEAFNAVFDAAESHQISDSMAEMILLDQILHDAHLCDPALLRAYVMATLDMMDAPEMSPAEEDAMILRATSGTALLDALEAAMADATSAELVTTLLPAARLQ